MARSYDMTRRAQSAGETREQIAAMTEALLATQPIAEVTLQSIADAVGISVQTVLRHMRSRDGCLDAARARVVARIEAQRGRSRPGDVDGALDELLDHYEAEGRLVLNMLAQAEREPLARAAVENGRAFHRAWVERCFGATAAVPEPRQITIDALVAATDLYVWKLLRLDLQRSPADTRAALERLVRAVLDTPCPRS